MTPEDLLAHRAFSAARWHRGELVGLAEVEHGSPLAKPGAWLLRYQRDTSVMPYRRGRRRGTLAGLAAASRAAVD